MVNKDSGDCGLSRRERGEEAKGEQGRVLCETGESCSHSRNFLRLRVRNRKELRCPMPKEGCVVSKESAAGFRCVVEYGEF